jgi:hypothetical protein
MRFFGKNPFLILALSQITGGALIAGQPASVEAPVSPVTSTNGDLVRPLSQRKEVPVPQLPAPPIIKSPVNFFRELLAMTPSERMTALSNRPPETRKQILAKVREYRSLSENERELRLRATELEWYLVPLMKLPATNRAARLVSVPEEYRKMIQIRLDQWDILPDATKSDLLARRESIRIYLQKMAGQTVQTNTGVPGVEDMPDPQRQQLISQFKQIFDLSYREKQAALRNLSPAEQRQITNSLAKFASLTPAQRAQCVRSFDEFSKMSHAERQQFLKNAERWIMMTPDQRRAWRDVVEKVSLMPSFPVPVAPRPPGSVPAGNRKADLTTNGS